MTRRRRREFYTTLEKAKAAANLVVSTLQSGDVKALELTNQDRSNYLHAVELLAPLGIRLDIAVSEYVEAVKALGKTGTLLEAARFHSKHHPADAPRKKVRKVMEELLEAKRADQKSLQ